MLLHRVWSLRTLMIVVALATGASPIRSAAAQRPGGMVRDDDGRIVHPTPRPATSAPVTSGNARTAELQRAYQAGVRTSRIYPVNQTGWNNVARYTGYSEADLTRAFDAIYVVTFAYQYLLRHNAMPADSATVASLVARQIAGEPWTHIWRDVAQSPERERSQGWWAPAPLEPAEVRGRFNLGMTPGPEQCFGGIGDKCDSPIPGYPSIAPRWHDTFRLPDGTEMGFVDIGVAVGSILHDNTCLWHHEDGLNCNGLGAGDLTKHASWPGAIEWNKASWNVIDRHYWKATFGPYPTDKDTRRAGWYDDLRPAKAREAWMAPVLGMVTTPDQTIRYSGGETRETARLKAPRGNELDGKDAAFCTSQTFSKTINRLLKAPSGVCQ